MKAIVIKQSKEREAYVPAKVREIKISTQSVICQSPMGTNEEFDYGGEY